MSSLNAYSPLKIYWHRDKLDAILRGEVPTPAQIQLVISDLCNQDCAFCAYRMSGNLSNELFGVVKADGSVNNNPNRMIAYEKIVEILEDAAAMEVKAIQLTGGGEPTVHPKFEQVVEKCYELGLEVGLVTNGVKLSPHAIELLMKATWVRISIDADSVESYVSIRRVPVIHYNRAWDNIKALAKRKKETGSNLTIGVGFVVTHDNYTGVINTASDARSAGADSFRISAVFQPDDEKYFESFHETAAKLCTIAEQLNTDTFQVVNMFGDRVSDLVLKYPDYEFCGYQQFNTYIGADLNVYRCCVLAYNNRGIIGSLKEQTFANLWANDAPKAFHGFNAGECPRCQFNNKNREIIRAMTPPPHVNFV
jgi:wyosine [tRNA(Phe)-imidazoG37] synthetase (radical SAM superfamily)